MRRSTDGARPSDADAGRERRLVRQIVILVAATALGLLPFVTKAFHIDDPLFVWTAQQISAHPLDPYGAVVNWDVTPQPIAAITQNPPLASAYMAAAAFFVGWSEVALHLAFLPWALVAVLGTWFLARRICGGPLLAALLALATPVFLVSASLVMCDVMMLALWIWSVALWREGLERGRARWLIVSALLMGAAVVTKYFAVCLVPLLFAFSVWRERRVGLWVVWFAFPVAVLLAYDGWMQSLYGASMLARAGGFAALYSAWAKPVAKALVALAFTGGCVAPALFLAPLIWSRRALILWALAAVAGAVVLPHISGLALFGSGVGEMNAFKVAQFAVMAAAGASLVAAAAASFRMRWDADALLLLLWIGGTFLFAAFFNWSVNGRSILPMVPAAGILLVRRIEERGASFRAAWVLLAPAAIAALVVAFADFTLANAARRAAGDILSKYAGHTVWFQGHWGFQHYMERGGAKPLDMLGRLPARGDVMASPIFNTSVTGLYDEDAVLAEMIHLPVFPWLATMRNTAGAGFYADIFGPLPFAAGFVGPEVYEIHELRRTYSGPRSARFRMMVGGVLARAGREDEALTWFREAARLNPRSIEAQINAGNLLLKRRQFGDAAAQYREALRIQPDAAAVHDLLAVALYASGDYAGAVREVELCRKYGGKPSAVLVKALSVTRPQ